MAQFYYFQANQQSTFSIHQVQPNLKDTNVSWEVVQSHQPMGYDVQKFYLNVKQGTLDH
jgi:hypothetical protein